MSRMTTFRKRARRGALGIGVSISMLAVVLGTNGCGSKQATAEVSPQASAMQKGAYVPVGTEVSARMQTGISTDTSSAGQTFSAVVLRPLRMVNGSIIVPVGATITGHVVDLDRSAVTPALRLGFDQIATASGPVNLKATLGQSQHGALAEVTIFGPGKNYDALIRGNAPRAPTPPAIGGGPSPSSEGASPGTAEPTPSGGSTANPSECNEAENGVPPAAGANAIRLPAGTEFSVVLTEPLVKPANPTSPPAPQAPPTSPSP